MTKSREKQEKQKILTLKFRTIRVPNTWLYYACNFQNLFRKLGSSHCARYTQCQEVPVRNTTYILCRKPEGRYMLRLLLKPSSC